MVFNTTFNNISVILWQSVLLMEKIWVLVENHWPANTEKRIKIYVRLTRKVNKIWRKKLKEAWFISFEECFTKNHDEKQRFMQVKNILKKKQKFM